MLCVLLPTATATETLLIISALFSASALKYEGKLSHLSAGINYSRVL